MRSKYGSRKTVADGIQFDSQAEANYYRQLRLLQRAGEVKEIELQPRFLLQPEFRKGGKTFRKIEYVADFFVTYADGQQELIDVKGSKATMTEAYRLKRKWFEYRFQELEIKEVFT